MAVYDINGTEIAQDLPFNGEKVATFGDSITYMDGHTSSVDGETVYGYQSWLREIGLVVDNFGVDGAKLARVDDSRKDIVEKVLETDCSGYDYVMIAGGTNDYGGANPRQIGTLASSDYDTTTVIGACQTMIEKIINDKKNVKLFFIVPLQRADRSSANALGLVLDDYCNAIRLVAENYSIPVLDFRKMGGINKANASVLTKDGLHPKNIGYAFLANKLQKFVQDL